MPCGRVVNVAGQLPWQLGVVDALSGCCIYGGASDPLPQRLLQFEKNAMNCKKMGSLKSSVLRCMNYDYYSHVVKLRDINPGNIFIV
jgi:hypothetical protein